MSTTIPASLKEADIMRFAHRAQQLEKVVPVVAYWCRYWILQQIITKGLHNKDGDALGYTTGLMDGLEEFKAANTTNPLVTDSVAAANHVSQFATQTLNRADDTLRVNKASRQTADTYTAAATFFELGRIWGELDEETRQKVKYAKFHALRIVKALKEGRDPNEGNPKFEVEEEKAGEEELERELDALEAKGRKDVGDMQASVQDADADVDVEIQGQGVEKGLDLPAAPTTATKDEDFYAKKEEDDGESEAPARDPEGYFPSVPVETQLPDAPTSLKDDDNDDDGGDNALTLPDIPLSPPTLEDQKDPSTPIVPSPDKFQSFPPPPPVVGSSASYHPPSLDLPPSTAAPPSQPSSFAPPPQAPVYQPQFTAPTQTPITAPVPQRPTPQHQQPAPTSSTSIPSLPPAQQEVSDEAIALAQKKARWAISALNFEDVQTALRELRGAMEALGAR